MSERWPTNISGVFPSLTHEAELGPPRSECGIGALMPFAKRLWSISYVSHKAQTGLGTGLYETDRNLDMYRRPESVVGTYTNRMFHWETNQIIIGPHVIDADHNVRTVDALVDVRCCGTATHMTEPGRLVYVLGMEGELFELDVATLQCTQVCDLQRELGTEGQGRVHFKDCCTANGRLVVCSNEYADEDFRGERAQGRLAEFDGQAWTILERKPYVGLQALRGFGGASALFAIGWDQASALLSVHTSETGWVRYRLPKASHCFDHKWQTEWPRIREVEHERLLMDCHGMFYELSPHAFGGRVWGVRPISTHLWVVPDFCSWQGLLVMGSDNASCHGPDGNLLTAEPMSGVWMGKTDDLWRFGKPTGWGGPWWDAAVKAGEPSDPYLMTGFEGKCLHLTHDSGGDVDVTVELDFMGCGRWSTYETFTVAAGGSVHHALPPGMSAHWLRVTADQDCTATAQLHYT